MFKFGLQNISRSCNHSKYTILVSSTFRLTWLHWKILMQQRKTGRNDRVQFFLGVYWFDIKESKLIKETFQSAKWNSYKKLVYPLCAPRKTLSNNARTTATSVETKCTSAKVGGVRVIETMNKFKSRRTEWMLDGKLFKLSGTIIQSDKSHFETIFHVFDFFDSACWLIVLVKLTPLLNMYKNFDEFWYS